jgi:hypothetical protein
MVLQQKRGSEQIRLAPNPEGGSCWMQQINARSSIKGYRPSEAKSLGRHHTNSQNSDARHSRSNGRDWTVIVTNLQRDG